jgi:hypothetical protein
MESTWNVRRGFFYLATGIFFPLLPVTGFYANSNCTSKQKAMDTTTYSVKGVLHTANNQPVENAIVMITEGDYEFPDIASVSNEKGEFYLSNIHLPGNYTLQINSDDTSFKKKFFINTKDTVLEVKM